MVTLLEEVDRYIKRERLIVIKTIYREFSDFLDGGKKDVDVRYVESDFKLCQDLRRGDIISIDFGINIGREKSGIRPAIVVSDERMNKMSQNIIVAPLTKYSNRINGNGVVELLSTQFILSKKFYRHLKNTSIVQMEDIRSMSKKRICGVDGKLSDKSVEDMKACLRDMLF